MTTDTALQGCINQFLDEQDRWGWELAWDHVRRRLGSLVRTGAVDRYQAVYRVRHVLKRHTTEGAASLLAESLPRRGEIEEVKVVAQAEPARPDEPPVRYYRFSAFSGPRDTRARRGRATWQGLCRRLTDIRVYPSKDQCPLWTPAIFRGDARSAPAVEELSLLVLDFDDGVHWDAILPKWRGIAGIVHTSWSHTEATPKWRLIMPFERPVPREAWGRVWRWASDRVDARCDQKCKDTSRIYYAPARRSVDWPSEAFTVEGRPLLVPRSLLEQPQVDPMLRPPRRRGRRTRKSDLYKTDPHARRELGERLGGKLVSGGTQMKGARCPTCGEPSLVWYVPIGTAMKAWCNHKNTCRSNKGPNVGFWLDELDR